MLAVVDTNVLVSALLRPAGPPGVVLRAMVQGRLTPVTCQEAMAEYGAVLRRRKFGFVSADVNELLSLISQQARWVAVPQYAGEPVLPDEADWPFIACALAAKCPVITGNVKHFPREAGVRVMTAREWLDQLA